MGDVRVGTCSWTDATLLRSGWYPRGTKTSAALLRYYASNFTTVEVDSTFYAFPDRTRIFRWIARTPPGFLFNVKVWGLFTYHDVRRSSIPEQFRAMVSGTDSDRVTLKDVPKDVRGEVWNSFAQVLEPLHQAKRMGYLLFQLPPWIRYSEDALRYVRRVAEVTPPFRAAFEVRHRSWLEPGVRERFLETLREGNLAYVVVDEPQLRWTVPPQIHVTADWGAVIRFHGRNRVAWQKGAVPVAEKFRYAYDSTELTAWGRELLSLSDRVERLFVMFNNCFRDYAVRNAATMRCLLGGECRDPLDLQGHLDFGESGRGAENVSGPAGGD
jgi:uncharacterized protein YecE (DUF72 family)